MLNMHQTYAHSICSCGGSVITCLSSRADKKSASQAMSVKSNRPDLFERQVKGQQQDTEDETRADGMTVKSELCTLAHCKPPAWQASIDCAGQHSSEAPAVLMPHHCNTGCPNHLL